MTVDEIKVLKQSGQDELLARAEGQLRDAEEAFNSEVAGRIVPVSAWLVLGGTLAVFGWAFVAGVATGLALYGVAAVARRVWAVAKADAAVDTVERLMKEEV